MIAYCRVPMDLKSWNFIILIQGPGNVRAIMQELMEKQCIRTNTYLVLVEQVLVINIGISVGTLIGLDSVIWPYKQLKYILSALLKMHSQQSATNCLIWCEIMLEVCPFYSHLTFLRWTCIRSFCNMELTLVSSNCITELSLWEEGVWLWEEGWWCDCCYALVGINLFRKARIFADSRSLPCCAVLLRLAILYLCGISLRLLCRPPYC